MSCKSKVVYVAQNYRVIRKIGEGSFGQVYMGISMSNNIRVAIKMVMTPISL